MSKYSLVCKIPCGAFLSRSCSALHHSCCPYCLATCAIFSSVDEVVEPFAKSPPLVNIGFRVIGFVASNSGIIP
jgi:hypothetical protein